MKLGLFIDGSFLPSREGATQRVYLLARHLPEVGIETFVFHCYRGWSDIELIRQEDFTTYIVSPEVYYGDAAFFCNIISQEAIDILQMCDPPLILAQGLRIKQETRVLLVWEVHEVISRLAEQLRTTMEHRQYLKLLEYYASLCCDIIICFTEEDKRTLSQQGICLDKICVFPCGIDLSVRRFSGPSSSSSVVLFLGNMFYEPNYRGALSIARNILPSILQRRENVQFKLVGTHPEELKREYANRNLVFAGAIDDLKPIFDETAVAIAPVEACTGMRIKILDYMAAGLPVVSTPSAALGIRHDNTILIEDDIEQFADRILYLLGAREESLRLGQTARAQIEKYYGWSDIVVALGSFYGTARGRFPISSLPSPLLRTINRMKLPLPNWLEESLAKGRFAHDGSKAIDHPLVVRNHEVRSM